MNKQDKFVIGIMSGSSLDGVDLCYVQFSLENNNVNTFNILKTSTYPFTDIWKRRLGQLHQQSAIIYAKTHVYFGHYLAEMVNQFVKDNHISQLDFIASHGHTIFHDPTKSYTAQIGDGASLSALTGFPVICDFRSVDVALGGEGAPLAPVVERFLFPSFDFFLNIGGIANLSMIDGDKIVAQDVCAANQLLNYMAGKVGLAYDIGGQIAKGGTVNETLLNQLNHWPYFHDLHIRSIGNEMIRQELFPMLLSDEITNADSLATIVEHIALQIVIQLQHYIDQRTKYKETMNLLCTGGGVFNTFLIDVLTSYLRKVTPSKIKLVIPDKEIIEHKESLLIAFLGLRRWVGDWNSIATVTGAQKNTVNGCIYHP